MIAPQNDNVPPAGPPQSAPAPPSAASALPFAVAVAKAAGDGVGSGAGSGCVVYEERWRLEAADDDSRRFAEMAELFCVVCRELVWEAVVCEDCGKLLCSGCSSQWNAARTGANGYQCPCCRSSKQPVSIATNCKQVALKNFLGKLRLKCPGYAYDEAGCTWKGDYFDAKSHVQKSCGFVTVECEYCKLKAPRKQMGEHSKTCALKPILCPHCLQGPFPPSALRKHQDTECKNVTVKCNDCLGWTGPRGQLSLHVAICTEVTIRCQICPTSLKRKLMHAHNESDAIRHVQLLLLENQLLKEQIEKAKAGLEQPKRRKRKSTEEPPRRRSKRGTVVLDVSDDDPLPDPFAFIENLDDDDDSADRWIACSTEPKCPFDGKYDRLNPFGKRCVLCNTQRKQNKVPCSAAISDQCWGTVHPHPDFGTTCKPCRDHPDHPS